jgi:uncharacterized protein (DUF58 family)
MKNKIKSLYIKNSAYILIGIIVLLFIVGFVFPVFYLIGKAMFYTCTIILLADIFLLYRLSDGIEAERILPDRFSNGDENEVKLQVRNNYRFPVQIKLIDELPFQFQIRDFSIVKTILSDSYSELSYSVKPVKRGSYSFGAVNIFATGAFRLVSRRYRFDQGKELKVYPSFLQLKKYELIAFSEKLQEYGMKRMRKIGQNREFDQIRNYVSGDDIRTINWKATARKADVMVNQYQDERSQQVYFILDKGRSMKMPFNQMTLLDYAINSSLILSNITLKKQDKAGLITFNKKIGTLLPAERKPGQLEKILNVLYNEKTAFSESNNEVLFSAIWNKINQRSLLFLFTNFESISSLKRQLPYFRKIALRHLLVVVFFENSELSELTEKPATNLEGVYIKTIAEKLRFEKRLIAKELSKYGIIPILTTPEKLSVDLINKYLEIKARKFFKLKTH